MKTFTTASLLALSATAAAAAADNPLKAEQWQTRPLIVMVEDEADPLLARVRQTLAQPASREAFVERDMVLYTVIGRQGRRNDQPLEPDATERLLAALDAGSRRPQLILVGKDGGKKVEEGADADLQAIFRTIDRMPMRQRD